MAADPLVSPAAASATVTAPEAAAAAIAGGGTSSVGPPAAASSPFSNRIKPPKVLGDLVESVVAAVFMDSRGDLGAAWKVRVRGEGRWEGR